MASIIPSKAARASRFLTFALGSESYGIKVLTVQEIIRLPSITCVPQLPRHLRGVINLRGRIIPVVDLRLRFDLPNCADTERTCVIVVQIRRPGNQVLQMGLVVDSVEEVIHVGDEDMSPPPDFGAGIDVSFLLALARVKGTVKTLLNIQRVLTDDEFDEAAASAAA